FDLYLLRSRHPRPRRLPARSELSRHRRAGVRSVSADGARRNGRGAGGGVKYFVTIGAQTIEVEVEGARVLVGGETFETHLAAGQRVEAGAGLVVVEAMKMENELRASRAAVVQTVHVTVGQPVEKGAPLVTLAGSELSG